MLSRLAALFGVGPSKLTPAGLEQALEQAIAALRDGDGLKAEETIHRAVEQAAAQEGRDSHLYAQALFHEATILCGVGDLVRAAAACRAAADVPARNQAGQKDRLTYLMNLGDILTRAERHDEAEPVLREGLAERETFYGTEHPGYAFGLAPLADNLLAQGRAVEALPLIDQAVEINWKAGHEAVASDLAIRAFVVKAAEGPQAEALEHWPQLPPHLQQSIVEYCLDRAERADPHAAQAVLLELRQRLQNTPDVEVVPLLNVNTQLANVSRLTEDHDVRIEACKFAIKLCGGLDDPKHVVNAYEGLAMALDDAGMYAEAEQAYTGGLEKARKLGHRRLAANVLRNYALWLDQRDRKDEAAAVHEQAVAEAADSNDPVMQGRCLAARGIFLQHRGNRDEALKLLQQSLRLLPPSHADAFCAQSHVLSLESGQNCMCTEKGDDAISALAEQMVRAKAPTGLLKSFRIDASGSEGPSVRVELARQPTDAELEHLNRVINQTIAEMRSNYRRSGFAAD